MIKGKKLKIDFVVLIKEGQHIKIVSDSNHKEEDVLYVDKDGIVVMDDFEGFIVDNGLELV